jgi:hypothetical protein
VASVACDVRSSERIRPARTISVSDPKRSFMTQQKFYSQGKLPEIEDSFEAAKNEFGLDHNESRSWHGWNRHVSLVMLAFAMKAVIRHRANSPPHKKLNVEPWQNPKHRQPIIDPLVTKESAASPSGSPESDPARTHHRMVTLVQSSPDRHSACASQSK